jgi:glyoxylase-like metal-dependent hydrolase (beta-lactamase superfamily II)
MNAPHPPPLDYPYAEPPAPGRVTEVANGVWWLRMPLPFALNHINLWLMREDAGFRLVDTGYGDAPTRALWETHFAATLEGRPITRILATHYHPDHLGNAAWLAQRFDCGVVMTHGEFMTAHAVADERAGFAPADFARLFASHGMAPEHVAALGARGNLYRRGVPEVPARYARMVGGEDVSAGGCDWRVIIGRGHSPEHAALHATTAGVLISGDMLLPKITTNVSVPPSEPDGDTLARFLASLDAFAALPDSTLVLPSHGLPFRGIAARVDQLRTHHVERLAELEAAVRSASGPVSAADILPVLFRRELDLQQRFFAMGEAIAHLNHLWHAGRISRTPHPAGAVRFAA